MTPQEMDIVDALGKLVDELRTLRQVVEKITVKAQAPILNLSAQLEAQKGKPQGKIDSHAGLRPQDARQMIGLKAMAQSLADKSEKKYKPFWQGVADKPESELAANQTLEERINKAWYKVFTIG